METSEIREHLLPCERHPPNGFGLFILPQLPSVPLDDLGRSQKVILHQNWAQGTIWKLPQVCRAVFLPGCLGEKAGTSQYADPILIPLSTEAKGLFI